MEDVARDHARIVVIEEHADVADVVRLGASAPDRSAQRERSLIGIRKVLGEVDGDERAQGPAHDVDLGRRSERLTEQITELVRARRAVLHGPSVLGIARVRHGVALAQECLPELHDPGRHVGGCDVGQRDRRRRVDESMRIDDQPPVPHGRQEHRVLSAVAHSVLRDNRE